MSIYWYNNHILWNGGHIAHSEDCCCTVSATCCGGACTTAPQYIELVLSNADACNFCTNIPLSVLEGTYTLEFEFAATSISNNTCNGVSGKAFCAYGDPDGPNGSKLIYLKENCDGVEGRDRQVIMDIFILFF